MEDKIIKVGNYGNGHHAKDITDPKGIMPTITTGNHGTGQAVCIKNNTKKGYSEAEFGDGIDISARMESHRGTVQKGLSQTIKTQIEVGVLDNERERESNCSIRIRKLTPKECMRLMGFQDEDYESLVKAGLSDSGIYHIAGDSIVVSVLIGIFGEMFNSYDIEKYVEEIKK